MDDEKVWVVIPACNEEKTIRDVILAAREHCFNVMVVDDGSEDKTAEIAKEAGAGVLSHIVNLGKGAALKTGCDYAYLKKAEKIVVMDADGQHQASEIPNFLKKLENCDIVFGYRMFNKNMPWIFKLGNYFITLITHCFYGLKLDDTQCGYRALTAEAYRKVRWKVTDYSMESEMIANAGKNHLRYEQVPIQTVYLDKYKGTTVFDGIKIVFNLFFWRLK